MNTPLRILNLEDNRNDAELNHAMLESAGIACEIVVVETQEAYLAALDQDGWDLILADYALPAFDGLAALDLARKRRPETPFIFVSGALGEEIAIESLKRGATDYVLKTRLSRLAPAVHRALQEREARLARQRAEAEVVSLKNYLANIIDSMPVILVGIDRHDTVTRWNRQAEELTGIPASAAVGQPIAALLPEFAPWIAALQSEIAQQHRPADREHILSEQAGERRFYDLMLYPLIANGVEGAVLRIEDVTERVRIRELLIQTEKMTSVAGLAAGLAHEINNPLGIISQAAQNIERRISPDLPANRQAAGALGLSLERMQTYFTQRQIPEFLGSIRTAAARGVKIVANMLRFSHVETIRRPASLSVILEQAVELAASDYDLKKKYDFRNIAITRDYAPEIPDVPVVAVEIEQVLLNLLKNAAQAMIVNPPDRPSRITLRLRRDHRYAVIEVEDNGPGMDETIRRRVFEPFFTTKEPGIGTGLGLSVSYMIITQNHKGLIEVASTPGTGTCFTVRLPLTSQAEEHTS